MSILDIELEIIQHIFISNTVTVLPSWHQAFPSAVCTNFANAKEFELMPAIIWFRLSAEGTVAQQITALRKHFVSQALVVLSDIPNDLEALAVFASSARGYCNTHAGEEVLGKIAGVVSQGGLWIGESIMQRLLNAPMSKAADSPNSLWARNLTEREYEVAKAVALGASNKEIAAQLGITERTIKAHVGAILEKVQVRDRLQLALLVKDS